jgi:serine/threonine protein kinase
MKKCLSKGKLGVPDLLQYRCDDEYHFIAMEMVGKTLESLSREHAFSPLTVSMLAIQLITSIEAFHAIGYVHRDIKPDNLAIALEPRIPTIYLLDVGMASKYQLNGIHVKYTEDVSFAGNYVFCSCNVLNGVRPSRRDDLESLAYVLVYLRSGRLPWIKINSENLVARSEHYQKKMDLSPTQVCVGLEHEYQDFLSYCRGLRFDEKPNYAYLKDLFQGLAERLGFDGLWAYSWLPPKQEDSVVTAQMRRLSVLSPSPGQRLESLAHPQSSPSPAPALSPLPLKLPQSEFVGRCKLHRPRVNVMKLEAPQEEAITPQIPASLNIQTVRKRLKDAAQS